jgi:hypothetical protein
MMWMLLPQYSGFDDTLFMLHVGVSCVHISTHTCVSPYCSDSWRCVGQCEAAASRRVLALAFDPGPCSM